MVLVRQSKSAPPRDVVVLAEVSKYYPGRAAVRALVAQGLSDSAHMTNILTKFDLPPVDDTLRRVRAVLAYLNH